LTRFVRFRVTSVESTSPFDSVVRELLTQEAEVVKVGAGLCLIDVDEDALDTMDSTTVELVSPSGQAAQPTTTYQAPLYETKLGPPLEQRERKQAETEYRHGLS
jgi:2-oxoisovalerate dehydrogenase E2 component (dihydrolipoyl transacylase)